MAPEGSPERIRARRILTRSAAASAAVASRWAWLERVREYAPELVDAVGPDELERIANYVWG